MKSLLCQSSSSRCPLVSSLACDPCCNTHPVGNIVFIFLCAWAIKEKKNMWHEDNAQCVETEQFIWPVTAFSCVLCRKEVMVCCEPLHIFFNRSHSLHLCQRLYFAFSLEGCCVVLGLSSSGWPHFFPQLIVINTGKPVHLRVTLWSAWAWLCLFILCSNRKREEKKWERAN